MSFKTPFLMFKVYGAFFLFILQLIAIAYCEVPSMSNQQSFCQSVKAHTNQLTSLAISPDGKYLVSNSDDKSIVVRSLPNLQILYKISSPSQSNILLSPKGNILLVEYLNATNTNNLSNTDLSLYTFPDLKLLSKASRSLTHKPLLNDPDDRVFFTEDGEYLIATHTITHDGGGYEGQIRVISTKNGKVLRDIPGNIRSTLALDSNRILTFIGDTAKIISSQSGKIVNRFSNIDNDISYPNGYMVNTKSGYFATISKYQHNIHFYSLSIGNLQFDLKSQYNNIMEIKQIDSDLLAATTSKYVIEIWSISKRQIICTIHGCDESGSQYYRHIMYIPKEQMVITYCPIQSKQTIKLWNISNIKSINEINFPVELTDFTVSQSAQFLIAGDKSGYIYVWDLLKNKSGNCINQSIK